MLGIPTETVDDIRATVKMIKDIDPDYFSPAFYTPQPGTELGDYVNQHDLSLINGYPEMSRNPNKPKIKGIDYIYLQQALEESTRRRPYNRIRRQISSSTRRLKRFVKKTVIESSITG